MRQIAVLLLIAIVLIARFASSHQQTVFVDVVLASVWMIFVFLGLKALLARKEMSRQMKNARLFALAAGRGAEWLGFTFAVVGALVLIFGGFTISGVRQDWSALGGILIFIAWYFIWRGAYAIGLNGALHYNSLFGGYRQIRCEGVSSARLIVGVHPTRPSVRLEIYPVSEEEPIVINRAVFRRPDMESVVKWLGPKLRAGAGAAR